MKKLSSIAFAALVLLPLLTYSQGNLVNVPALRVEPDPISTGRGMTGVAQADQGQALYWNPAGLAYQKGWQLKGTRFNYLPGLNDLSYNYVSVQKHLDDWSTLGGHITYLDLGSQIGQDPKGNPTGDISSHEVAIGLSYGRIAIPNTLTLGLGVRYTSSKLATSGQFADSLSAKTGNAISFDMGMFYEPGEWFIGSVPVIPTIGVSITNFGGRMEYSDSGFKNPLPTLLRVGVENTFLLDENAINTLAVSVEVSKYMVRMDSTGAEAPLKSLFNSWGRYEYYNGKEDVSVGLGKQLMYGVGLEYWYNNLLAVRGGYYNESQANGGSKFLTTGMSVRFSYLQLNGSFAIPQNDTEINNYFRFGINLRF
ncbi:hypothetical protein SAMN05443144_13225 [Fodinibius roseus]|uniref:Type IX secretion system protein PorV domain-containing protein n=1 Tax=Fodinibius roseus TaxID=1194090 RepID=A0A1M5KIP6_9BACT|nr:PorV/PorQ family protein [Fodinibius roseus]SHG52647.1 hypothetical protein SAMN05443144_13225 [Fodinibius roseus]